VALILDTNAVSAMADREPLALEVAARAVRLAVPVIVLGEYRIGIPRSRYRGEYEAWLQELTAVVPILDIDKETSQFYADISLELKAIGKPIPTNDLWIAALCRQHAMPLLSRDRHFDVVKGLKRFSW
jgi:tRNA(fMet)-specific endonuclease VapC